MTIMDWKPLSEERILEELNTARKNMNPLERRFWDSICIDPEKWRQHPYGDFGNGFWVVAIIGKIVVWYNDIEEGFNRSRYVNYGEIPADEYWCNQDSLGLQIRQLMHVVATGENSGARFGPPQAGEFQPR
jgi:hypothetical protein